MKLKHLLFACIIFFNNCGSSEKGDENKHNNKIIGSWELAEVRTFDKNNLDMDEATRAKKGSELLSNGLTLHFFPDSTYTTIEDSKIKHGQWTYLNEKEITYGNQKLSIDHVEDDKTDKRLLVSIRNEDDTMASELTLVEATENLKDFKKDPFYPDNNTWRQRPLKKETNREISTRLANYILHNAYVLKAAHERLGGTVSFRHSQGIIKVYQGAIGIVKENKIKKSWIDSYFDEEDAMKAYYLYKSYLGKEGVYKVKSTGDWVKDDYEILLTLYTQIQKTKEEDTERFTK